MKKKGILLSALVGALAIGVSAFAIVNNINKTATQLDANYNDNTSVLKGLYVRVTNPNTIENGEKLLLVGNGNRTIQYFVGASYHYWITTEHASFAKYTDDYIYANNEKGELVTFEKSGDNFYLKLDHFVDNTGYSDGVVRSGYLVNEAYNNNGVTAFGDLYFRTKKDKPSANAAKWSLQYDGNHMIITSVSSGRRMFWKPGSNYYWDAFALSTNLTISSNINLYRRAKASDFDITVTTGENTKDDYVYGEDIDLTDVSVAAEHKQAHFTINSTYNNDSYMYQPVEISFFEQLVKFTWCSFEASFDVTVDHDRRDEHLYLKPDGMIQDLRGSYVLAFDFDDPQGAPNYTNNTCIMDVSTITSGDTGADVDFQKTWNVQNPINDTNYALNPADDGKVLAVSENVVKIDASLLPGGVDYGYRMKVQTGGDAQNPVYSSICIDASGNPLETPSYGKLKLGSDALSVSQNEVTSDNQNHIYIGDHQRMLVFNKTTRKIITVSDYPDANYIPLCLYKLQMTKNLNFDEEIEQYRTSFFSYTSNYDPTAATKNIDRGAWTSVKSAFNKLSLDSQSYLAALTYTHNQEESGSFGELADRYDSIVNTYYDVLYIPSEDKYGFEDFMRRGLAGTLQSARQVEYDLTDCTVANATAARYRYGFSVEIVPDAHFTYPDAIQVYMSGNLLTQGTHYDYDSSTGEISIGADVIVDNLYIVIDAKVSDYTVTFVGFNSSGVEQRFTIYNHGSYTLPTYSVAGFETAPEGKQFRCWAIGGNYYQPGATYTISDNIEIHAVYESAKHAVREIENKVSTKPYLTYDYIKNGENDFEFSNIVIRFRGIVSKALWDELNGNYEDNILGYGVLLSTEEYLAGAKIKDLFDNVETPEGDSVSPVDDVNLKDYRSNNIVPTFIDASTYSSVIAEDSYCWNLRKLVGTTEEQLTTRYVAVAYILTRDDGMVFLNQVTASVSSLAKADITSGKCDASSLDGSVKYLADLED